MLNFGGVRRVTTWYINVQVTIFSDSFHFLQRRSHYFKMTQNTSTQMSLSEIRDAVLNFDAEVRSGIEGGNICGTMRRIGLQLVTQLKYNEHTLTTSTERRICKSENTHHCLCIPNHSLPIHVHQGMEPGSTARCTRFWGKAVGSDEGI